MSVSSVLGRLRQEEDEFKASLGYILRAYLKKKKNLISFYWVSSILPGMDRPHFVY
jgi:hypothetical protein